MTSTRLLYTRTLTAQGCESIIGGKIDSYFFPISSRLHLHIEVTDETIEVRFAGFRSNSVLLTSPDFTGELDIPAYARQLPLDHLYQQRTSSEDADEDLTQWLKVYAEGYSFAIFKQASLALEPCLYAFSFEEELVIEPGEPLFVENMEVEHYTIDVHSDAGAVVLNYGGLNREFNRSLLEAMEDECDLVQPYTAASPKLLSFFRRKRITQIVDSI